MVTKSNHKDGLGGFWGQQRGKDKNDWGVG